MSWSARERTLFYATTGVVALGAAWFLLADPALKRYDAVGGKQQKARERRDKLQAGKTRQPAIRDEIQDIENQITASAPQTVGTDFNSDLMALGKKAGVTPSAITSLEAQPLREGFEEIVREIRMETDTAHLTDYLYWLENSPRLLRISRLEISGSKRTKPGEGSLSVSMRLSTVVRSQAAGEAEAGDKKGDKKPEKKGEKK